MITTVPREHFLYAVAQVGGMNALYQEVSADANYPDWIAFNAAKYVKQGDALYTQTQMALGYTSAEMQFLFDLAVYQTIIPAQVLRSRNGLPVLDRYGEKIETR